MKSKIMQWLHIDDLIDNGRKYLDARIALVKLEIHQLLTNLVSTLVLVFSVLFFSLMMLAFFSIALGVFLNEKMNSSYGGYLIMAFIYMLVTGATFILLPPIKRKIHALCSTLLSDFIQQSTATIASTPKKDNHDDL